MMIEAKTLMFPNLVAEMARNGESSQMVAQLLKLSAPSFTRRMRGEIEWSKPEIDTLCEHYQKPYEYLFGK